MRLYMLKKFVRSSTDLDLQEVLTLFQKLQPTQNDVLRIHNLVRQYCHFTRNWDSVPPEALQIFGRRKAEQEAVERQLQRIVGDDAIQKIIVPSLDQYTLDGGNLWIELNRKRIITKMNRKLQAPQTITLYRGAIMRFTCNDYSARRAFHQSQLCVVRTLPVDEGSFTAWVAPPGRRNIPSTEQQFVDEQWQELTISKVFSIPQRLEGNMKVRREQYPIRHYIVATIHKVMGDTLGMVATQISDKKSTYKLWLESQLYVIISRVKFLHDIYFVGDVQETMRAITSLLQQSSQWEGYVRHVVRSIRVGDKITLCQPYGEGNLAKDATRLVQTDDRLMPFPDPDIPRPLPTETTARYSFGVIIADTIEITKFGLVMGTCGGRLCDSLYGMRCPCLATPRISSWVMRLAVETQSVNAELSISSSLTTELVATNNIRTVPLESTMVEALSVSDIADNLVQQVNGEGGWTLIVWSKSAHGDAESGIRPPKYHLIRLLSSNLTPAMANILNAQRYQGEPLPPDAVPQQPQVPQQHQVPQPAQVPQQPQLHQQPQVPQQPPVPLQPLAQQQQVQGGQQQQNFVVNQGNNGQQVAANAHDQHEHAGQGGQQAGTGAQQQQRGVTNRTYYYSIERLRFQNYLNRVRQNAYNTSPQVVGGQVEADEELEEA